MRNVEGYPRYGDGFSLTRPRARSPTVAGMSKVTAAVAFFALALLVAGCGTAAPKAVPDVTGQRLDVAEDMLDGVDLRYDAVGGGALGIVVRSHWTVCRQTPAPGASASSVTLFVARSCPTAGPDVVPDVIDDNLADAREELEAEGFAVVAQSADGDPILVEHLWTVCDQSPEPGHRGHTVELEVAHDCWDYS